MQIFRSLAGYSLGRADIVRRAMSKKKHDVMQREREIFLHGLTEADGTRSVDGCLARGVPMAVAEKIFDEMSAFASYAFNKSHAAAYALIAYRTAYLKALYPCEYMAALLTNSMDAGHVSDYIALCERMGIRIDPPDINRSVAAFAAQDGGIRFGLLAVRNLGRTLIDMLVRERQSGGLFLSFYDLCRRMTPYRSWNVRALESLIRCGALDSLGANRRQMLQVYLQWSEQLSAASHRGLDGQIGFDEMTQQRDSEPSLPALEEFSTAEKLAMEKEATGLYLSGNPLQAYDALAVQCGAVPIRTLLSEEDADAPEDGQLVRIIAMLGPVRRKATRAGAEMAYLSAEDAGGSIECILFPKVLASNASLLQEGAVLVIEGRLSRRDERDAQLLVERMFLPQADAVPAAPVAVPTAPKSAAPAGLYLTLPSQQHPSFVRCKLLLQVFEGEMPVFIRFADTDKRLRAPRALWIDPNDVLLRELQALLGQDKVRLVR